MILTLDTGTPEPCLVAHRTGKQVSHTVDVYRVHSESGGSSIWYW